jgi:hypothetical protein
MSSMKRNTPHLLKVIGLLALASLPLLNGRGDALTPDEQSAKVYGLTPEQLEHDKQEAKLNGLTLSDLEQGKLSGFTPKLILLVRKLEPQLTNEYSLALKSPEGASQLQATLRKALANIDAASTPVTAKGNNLPASFIDLVFPKQEESSSDFAVRSAVIYSPGFMGLSSDNYVDQLTLEEWVWQLITNAPEILMPVLQERAKVFPPTAADYILCFSVEIGIDEANDYHLTGVGVPPSCSVGLLTMAQARNPIYRFIAVAEAEFVEPDMTKRLNFYSRYVNETDPYILTLAINGVAETKAPTAKNVLQSFLPAVQKTGDAKLATRLQEQIQSLKL